MAPGHIYRIVSITRKTGVSVSVLIAGITYQYKKVAVAMLLL